MNIDTTYYVVTAILSAFKINWFNDCIVVENIQIFKAMLLNFMLTRCYKLIVLY